MCLDHVLCMAETIYKNIKIMCRGYTYQYPCIDIETENIIPVSFILCFKFHMHMKYYSNENLQLSALIKFPRLQYIRNSDHVNGSVKLFYFQSFTF